MRVDKDYYLKSLTDIKAITEIVQFSPGMGDNTRRIFLPLINAVEANTENSSEDYEILRDRLAGWLVNNQADIY